MNAPTYRSRFRRVPQPAVVSFEHLWENHAIDRLMTSVFERNALVQASDKEQTMQALCLAALFRADASVNEPQVCRQE